MTVIVSDLLDAYLADRIDVVIDTGRLESCVGFLRDTMGTVDAGDQAMIAASARDHGRKRRDAGRSDGTIRRELDTLRAALSLAWKEGRLPFRPYVALPPRPPGRQVSLTPEQARRLLFHVDRKAYVFCRIKLANGARLGAILDLTWDRVDFRHDLIDFRAPHPKAARRKRRAVVPMPGDLRQLLAREKRRATGPRVVPLSASTVQRLIHAAAVEADLDGLTPHHLRHTVATWMLGEGDVPLIIASRMLGHASTQITEQVYAHLTTAHLRPAAEFLARMVA